MHRSILRILTAIQLTRLTMAFGAISDLWLVILITRARTEPPRDIAVYDMPLSVALTIGATIAIGMFAYGASLNDVLDARHDSAFSPDRPIPAGRIRAGQAIVMTVGSLLIAVLAGQAFGPWALQLTLITAVGILFYNAAGKFIPGVGVITIGVVHATHMLIPNVQLDFTWPVWFVMTHAMAIGLAAYVLEGKRPRISNKAVIAIGIGWLFWSVLIIGWGVSRSGWWPTDRSVLNLLWPLCAMIAFFFVVRWKTAGVKRLVAAEKLKRYGAMWQGLYSAMWLFALGLQTQGVWLTIFAFCGFAVMTFLKEMMGQVNRPLTYRV